MTGREVRNATALHINKAQNLHMTISVIFIESKYSAMEPSSRSFLMIALDVAMLDIGMPAIKKTQPRVDKF